MMIRESKNSELEAICALHFEAFGEPEGEIITHLVREILNDESAKPLLSLVAEEEGKIVGHIIFSSLTVEGTEEISAYILAPLAVSKNKQKQGLGTQLITTGIDELKSRGAEVVFVYGDPNYYNRTGFVTGHHVAAPYELEYPEAWMAQELKANKLSGLKGIATCCSSLMNRKYW